MCEVFVHPHALKHGLLEREILEAWENFAAKQHRQAPNEEHIVAVGYASTQPRKIQMMAIAKTFGLLIYHAMTPAQKSVLAELGLLGR